MQQLLKLTVLLLLLNSCNNYKTKYPYSINDFRPELRKHLEKVVEMGILGAYYSKEFNDQCSVADLKKLLQCEHPLVRAKAFGLLAEKDTVNIQKILFASLYDTAIISVDHGEWGIPRMYCADYYFQISRRKIILPKSKLLDMLIEKHPYLKATFIELREYDSLPEKHHTTVKQMAVNFMDQFGGNGTPYITYDDEKVNDILFALSKYKKKTDVEFIRNNLRYATNSSWKIIAENPDTAYFHFFEEYYERLQKTNRRYSESIQIESNFEDFLIALSKYKNKKSAFIFSTILTNKLYPDYFKYKVNKFECLLYDILKQDSCEEYKTLLQSLKSLAEGYKTKHQIPIEKSTIAEETER